MQELVSHEAGIWDYQKSGCPPGPRVSTLHQLSCLETENRQNIWLKVKITAGRRPECVGGQRPTLPPVAGARPEKVRKLPHWSLNYECMWLSRQSQERRRASPDIHLLVAAWCALTSGADPPPLRMARAPGSNSTSAQNTKLWPGLLFCPPTCFTGSKPWGQAAASWSPPQSRTRAPKKLS